MAGYERRQGCVGSYVDLRHLVSGCGCEKTGSSIRCEERLKCWDCWSVGEGNSELDEEIIR
jgi:hypothetical protein